MYRTMIFVVSAAMLACTVAVPMSLAQDEAVIAAAAAAAENALKPSGPPPEDADIIQKTSTLGVAEAKAANGGAELKEGVDGVDNIYEEMGANAPDQHYPVDLPDTKLGTNSQVEVIAGPDVIDPKNESSYGVTGNALKLDRTDDVHPMEVKTPLPYEDGIQNLCDQNVVLKVEVPAAVKANENDKYPTLPAKYGCYNENEFSREKASPEVSFENIYEDVTDLTLQVISMGGPECPGPFAGAGENTAAGKVLWHVTDIKPTGRVVFPEGASHDTRTLNGGKEQPNQWLEEYYSGPCPPADVTECYRFMVVGHRGEGKKCQCGHLDVHFSRAMVDDRPADWIYDGTVFDHAEGKIKEEANMQ
jgi:phosphatidylethanolamine-binding protein (PEBP) family uncharacterized protein